MITGPVRGRQGDADLRAARARARTSSSRSRRRPARRARARSTVATTTSSRRRSSTGGSRPKTSSSSPPTAATATGRCAPRCAGVSTPAARSCSRSRCRARARCAPRCGSRSRSSSPRPTPTALRERLLESRGTDSAEAIDARLEVAEQELAAQDEFAHRVVNDDLERAAGELEGIVRAELGPTTTLRRRMIKPRVDKLLDHADSHYAAVVVAAKRARQINSYFHNLGEGGFGEYPPPMVETRERQELPLDGARGACRGQAQIRVPRLTRRPARPEGGDRWPGSCSA